MCIEKLAVVVDVHELVLSLDVGWGNCKLLFDGDHLVLHGQVLDERLVNLTFAQVLYQGVNHLNLEFKVVLGLVVLQLFEVTRCIDVTRQMVNVADFGGFDLELVVFTLTDNQTLHVVFEFVTVVVEELLFETEVVVLDDFILVVDIVVFVHPDAIFALAHHQMFKVVALHVTLEAPLFVFFGHFMLHVIVGRRCVFVHRGINRQFVDAKPFQRVFLGHVDVVNDVENFVCLIYLFVIGHVDQFQRALIVAVFESQIEDLEGVQPLNGVVQRCVVHEPAARVGHGLELLPAFGEVGGKAVEVLDLGVLHGFVLRPVVLLDELVLLLVLVLLFAEPVVLELFLVDAVDDEEVVADLLLEAHREYVVLAGLEVAGLLDLVLRLLLFAEDLVAVDEVLADAFLEVLFARHAFEEEVLQNVVVVGDLRLLLDGLGLAVLIVLVLLHLPQVGHDRIARDVCTVPFLFLLVFGYYSNTD